MRYEIYDGFKDVFLLSDQQSARDHMLTEVTPA